MKKYIAILIVAMMMSLAIPLVGADTTDTATITVTFNNNAYVEIDVSPSTWNPTNGVGGGAENKTDFTLYNNGTASVNVEVKCSDASNGWQVADLGQSAGHDTFKMRAYYTGWEDINDTYTTGWITNWVPSDGSKTIGFEYTPPTSSSNSDANPTATITIQATISG